MAVTDSQTTPWTERWSAVPESVGPIRHALVGYAESLGATHRALDTIALAVSEATTNAVLHAFVGRSAPGTIVVSAEPAGPMTLLVRVVDNGRGMTPRPDSPGLGLGLPLITQLADSVAIGDAPRGGTEVRMRFGLAA